MSEKRVNKSYSNEFKEETVALISEQGYSVAQAANAVGDSDESTVPLEARAGSLKSGQSAYA